MSHSARLEPSLALHMGAFVIVLTEALTLLLHNAGAVALACAWLVFFVAGIALTRGTHRRDRIALLLAGTVAAAFCFTCTTIVLNLTSAGV